MRSTPGFLKLKHHNRNSLVRELMPLSANPLTSHTIQDNIQRSNTDYQKVVISKMPI